MQKLIMTILLVIIAMGCSGPRFVDYFPYHDDGRAKPQVLVLPVMDSSKSCISGNLSQELTQRIYYEELNSGELYFFSPEEVQSGLDRLGAVDFFNSDAALAQQYTDADFAVLLELIEHRYVPESPFTCHQDACCWMLQTKIRVKVIDLRPRCPRLVLQEIVSGNELVPQQIVQANMLTEDKKLEEFKAAILCRVHQRIVSSLLSRLENVIKSAY